MACASPASADINPRDNAFGFLRLFFASLVIVSHAPELIDGDFSREPMVMLFGTVSLGDLAVDGFFIISGYLIVASFLKTGEIIPYLWRRIGRIYPGFIVATLFSLFVVAPLAGTTLATQAEWSGMSILRILLLQQPYLPDVFATNPITVLNGPMWTIAYEFRCYLLVILLAICGVFRKPSLVALLAVTFVVASQVLPAGFFEAVDTAIPHSPEIFGHLQPTLRLTGMFLAGSVFFLRPALIPRKARHIQMAVAGLVACLCFAPIAEPGIAIFGSLLIFAVAFASRGGTINRINARTDISYGVYLYAWPIGQLLVLYAPQLGVFAAGFATFLLAAAAGWASWHLIERRALQASRHMNWPNREWFRLPPSLLANSGGHPRSSLKIGKDMIGRKEPAD